MPLPFPLETFTFTWVPLLTFCPSAGSTLTTCPFGLSESTSVMFGFRPAPSRAAFASSADVPTTVGMVTWLLPLEMVTFTFAPFCAEEPASGSEYTIWSFGCSESSVKSTVPSLRPTFSSADRACSCFMPDKSGTATVSEPDDRYPVTVEPALTFEADEGLTFATLPSPTSSEATRSLETSHLRPTASTALLASSGLIPTRESGTATESGPLDSVAVMVDPSSACSPPGGFVETTDPSATLSEATLSAAIAHVKPADSTCAFASACV